MAKKKIKRRKVSPDVLKLRKQFEMDNTDSVFVDPISMKKKMPNSKKRKEYMKALIKDFDNKLAV